MTDNEAIERLSFMSKSKYFTRADKKALQKGIDLINRQQAEIKNQNRTIEMLDSSIKCYKHKIAEIENELDDLNCKLDMEYDWEI